VHVDEPFNGPMERELTSFYANRGFTYFFVDMREWFLVQLEH
jgi:hypothetical protein